jgi:hypothetical protein
VAAELVVAEVVGAALVVEAEELVVLEELPQPASAVRPAATASTETVGRNCDLARAAVLNLTSDPPLVGAVGN